MIITPVELKIQQKWIDIVVKHISKALDEYTDTFDEATKSLPDFVHSWVNWFHTTGMEILEREKPSGDLLYIACAYGFGVVITKDKGYSVKGIDVNDSHVEDCRKRGLDVTIDDALATEFAPESFDISLSKDFLRWDYLSFEDIVRCLLEQHRILRKGGIVLSYSVTQRTDFLDSSLWRYKEMFRELPFREYRSYRIQYADENKALRWVDVFEK